MKKLLAATAAVIATVAVQSAGAADLQVKARPKPAAVPTWWVSAGALLWGVKSSPLPPTLTTFAAGSASATTGFGGELGVPGTSVLSPDHLGYGPLPGGQFSVGHWFEADPRFGVELDGFFLGSSVKSFAAASNGATPLRVPFFNVSPAAAGFPVGNSSFVLADPGFAAGSQVISSTLNLWGVEGNGLFRGTHTGFADISLLFGLRYLDLREGLSIISTEHLLGVGTYVGADDFSTRNRFFGAQVGVKAEKQYGRFDGSVVAKVALGDNYQSVTINGASAVNGLLGTRTVPGGIFTQATNIGRQSRNEFAVVPEVQLQVGYHVTSAVRVFVGYDFLYVSNVVRPGNQIDTTLNVSGNSAIVGAGATLTGAARPTPVFNGSSFWAQGVKIGASYTF